MFKIILAISLLVAGVALGIPHAYAHHVLDEISVGQSPMKMSFDGKNLFVSTLGGKQINVINTETNTISYNITASSGAIAVEGIPKMNKLYVATFESGGIDVFSLISKSYIRTIPLPNSTIASYQSPNLDRPGVTLLTGGADLAYNPVNGLLYVANYNADYVAVIDPTTDQVLQSIPVPATPFSLKVDSNTGTILVASLAGNGVTFITPSVDNLTGKLSHDVSDIVKTGIGPWGIAIDSDEHRAYITNRGSNTITVLNMIDHQIMQQIPISGPAHAIAVDSGEHKVYASYLNGNNIVKIDGLTNVVEGTVDVEGNAWDIVADSNTHNVFTSIKDQNKVIILGPKSVTSEVQVVTVQLPVVAVGSITSHGQDVTIQNAYLDTDNKKLSLSVVTPDGGQTDITIPRNVLDSRQDGYDSLFQVLINGTAAKFDEVITTNSSRTLSIFVPKGTIEIDVVGTNAIPELGPQPSPIPSAINSTRLTLDKGIYFAGDSVVIHGQTYTNDTKVTIGLEKDHKLIVQSKEIQVNQNGTFVSSFTIPLDSASAWRLAVLSSNGQELIDLNFKPYPLKQFSSGTDAKNVVCQQEFHLLFKTIDHSPACVKSETANILIERGWAKPLQ